MPNIGALLKQEIARLSRREIRGQVQATKKASSQYRRHIATLKRQVTTLERQMALLQRRVLVVRKCNSLFEYDRRAVFVNELFKTVKQSHDGSLLHNVEAQGRPLAGVPWSDMLCHMAN